MTPPLRLLTLLLFFGQNLIAQVEKTRENPAAPTDTLDQAVLRLDSLLFDVAFNTCNLEPLEKLIHTNFEFYHDQSGPTWSKARFIRDIRTNICSLTYRPERELVAESHQVYPLYNNGRLYAALQTGEHRFYAREENKPRYLTSVARFSHLWLLTEDGWKLSRVLSYDHH